MSLLLLLASHLSLALAGLSSDSCIVEGEACLVEGDTMLATIPGILVPTFVGIITHGTDGLAPWHTGEIKRILHREYNEV